MKTYPYTLEQATELGTRGCILSSPEYSFLRLNGEWQWECPTEADGGKWVPIPGNAFSLPEFAMFHDPYDAGSHMLYAGKALLKKLRGGIMKKAGDSPWTHVSLTVQSLLDWLQDWEIQLDKAISKDLKK